MQALCQYLVGPLGKEGVFGETARTIIDWKRCIKLCWHICRTPSQEAYSSVNRPLCHCLSMWFGHMKRPAPFLCNADKKGEEGAWVKWEETPVTNRKRSDTISCHTNQIFAGRSDGMMMEGLHVGYVWMRILGEERTAIIISGVMMMSTWLMGRFSRSIQSGLRRAVTVMTALAYTDT